MHWRTSAIVAVASIAGSAYSQHIAQDPGRGGVSIELVHLYNDEYPQGMPDSLDEKPLQQLKMLLADNIIQVSLFPPQGASSQTTLALSTRITSDTPLQS